MTAELEPRPLPAARRRLLPVIGTLGTAAPVHHGGRSAMTCLFRCGNACSHEVPNTSDNAYFGDVVAAVVSRRGVLKAGAVATLAAGAAPLLAAAPAAADQGRGRGRAGSAARDLSFQAVPPNTRDTVVVPPGYDWSVVMAWGDPVVPGAPAFDFDNQTAAAQARQFGYNCDYVAVLPLPREGGDDRALLVVNHEYTDEALMFHGYTTGEAATPEQIRIAMMAHGISVVEIRRVRQTGRWVPAPVRERRRFNRRITAATPMLLTGPAAGSAHLRTSADPSGTVVLGTLNDCAGGTTPWGTTLHGEENFNQYFVGANAVAEPGRTALRRYGFDTTNRIPRDNRRWDRVDARFDLAQEPNEANRFGWIVELDPSDPTSMPRKRTALGRFKHEGATLALAKDGRAVAYMGDDERFDYVYKFVSSRRFRSGNSAAARRNNMTLLDHGTLYVARFTGDSPASEIDGSGRLPSDGAFDGTGEWIPLVTGDRSHVPGMTAEEVLIFTRLAADKVGATKMDRPEDIERNPVTGSVYLALTNNSRRTPAQVDEANPIATSVIEGGQRVSGNRNGHVLELDEARLDPAATRFTWRIFLVAGDPNAPETYFAGFPKDQVSPISCPDNVAFDRAGNLWIATDGNVLGSNDGLFATPVRGPERGHLKQFLTVPVGAETCGPFITDDDRSVFVAVQHPGEVDGATTTNRASTFPYGDQPRPSVVVAWRSAAGSDQIGA